MSVINKELVYGDEELVEQLDIEVENARKSHTDGSHINPELTYNQRMVIGGMLLEMAGDI